MNKSFTSLIKENWILLAFLVQLILTWGFLQNSVTNHEERIKTLESERVSEALSISEINSRLSSIETSLIFIKEALR